MLELLAGIPTVVFGYFALVMVTPALQYFMPELPGFNMLGPGLVIGIMIIPYISSVAEDAMRAVPLHMREGSYAMGATRLQTALRVVVPAATSGIVAAYILGDLARHRRDDGGRGGGGAATQLHLGSRASPAPRSPRSSCRWRWVTCHTAASSTRASSPSAWCWC